MASTTGRTGRATALRTLLPISAESHLNHRKALPLMSSKNRPRALLAALCASAVTCAAAQTQPWTLTASQELSRDTNVYRLADGVAAAGGLKRGDTLSTTTLAAGLDQRIGRQHLLGEAALRVLRYGDNGRLDHEGHTLAAAWAWETVERLSGTLRAGSTRSLRPYASVAVPGSTARNLETTNEVAALARLGGAGRLSLEGALGTRQVDYSDPAYATAELRTDTLALGGRWRTSGALVYGAAWRHTWARYPVLGDRYHVDALDFSAESALTGASRLYLRLSPTRARYDAATERDFSGLTAAAQWRWQAGGKLALTLRAVRDLGQDAYLERYGTDGGAAAVRGNVDDSTVLTRVALEGVYAYSDKTQLSASLGTTRRELSRLPPGQTAVLEGRDTTAAATLGLRWSPTRHAALGCDAGLERRTASGALSGPYNASTLTCFARLGWR